MKKTLVVCLALFLLLTACLPTVAEGFVSSPSAKQAPELVEGSNASEDCEAVIVITAYGERENLNQAAREKMEEAYEDIINAPTLGSLNSDINKIAKKAGIKNKDLSVSDLFDITATHCETHEDHQHFDITLKAESLEHFVCLLHFYNGKWEIVEGAEVTHNGTHLEFDIKDFSPFAIVVDTSAMSGEAPASHTVEYIILGVAVAAFCAALIILIIKKKKKEKEEETK